MPAVLISAFPRAARAQIVRAALSRRWVGLPNATRAPATASSSRALIDNRGGLRFAEPSEVEGEWPF